MSSTFSLKIIACDRVFYEGESKMLVFPGYDGEMAIMAHHEAMTSTVEIGEIRYQLPDDTWQVAIVSDGLLQVEQNQVNIIVYSAEKPEEIDAFRAEAALARAKEQMQQKQSLNEYRISQASLARAMARLRSVNKSHLY